MSTATAASPDSPRDPTSAHKRRRFRPLAWLAALLEVIILMLALVGGLAAYLHPHTFWWAQLVAIGLPYWTALLGLGTLGLLLSKQRGWALAYALLFAWLAVRTLPLGWITSQPEAGPDDLTLLTFNTPASGASRDVLADGIRLFFEDTNPIIAGLQETVVIQGERRRWQPTHLDQVTDSLGYQIPMPPPGPDGMARTEVALLLRPDQDATEGGFEVLTQQAFEVFPDQDYATDLVRTHFRWQGREGVHYNLHLASFGDDKPWADGVPFYSLGGARSYLRQYRDAYRRRASHVEQIRPMLEQETLPILLSGDFNTTPYNWSYRQLKQDRTDAFRMAGAGWGGTYRADLPLVRIDFVLADPAWEVVSATVPSLFLSDHKPLLVRLHWADVAETDAPD